MKNAKTMTEAELVTAARDYDRAMNEGGEGYNPYRSELARRDAEHEATRPRERYDILRDLERLDCAIARESGTYDPERIAALRAELAALDQAEADAFAAVWTAEVTAERRAEWNARVRAGEFTAPNGKADMAKVAAAQRDQGWITADLAKAIKLHNL